MGFGPVPPEHTRRLGAADRRRGHAPRSAPSASTRGSPRSLIAPADADLGRGAGHRLRVARHPRPAARARGRAAVGRGGRAPARRRRCSSRTQIGLGLGGETPLWFYILKEAEVLHDGDQLGPVGGRIVGEVLVGIIDADPASFRAGRSLVDAWSSVRVGVGARGVVANGAPRGKGAAFPPRGANGRLRAPRARPGWRAALSQVTGTRNREGRLWLLRAPPRPVDRGRSRPRFNKGGRAQTFAPRRHFVHHPLLRACSFPRDPQEVGGRAWRPTNCQWPVP